MGCNVAARRLIGTERLGGILKMKLSKIIEMAKNEPVTGVIAFGIPSDEIKVQNAEKLEKWLAMVGIDIDIPDRASDDQAEDAYLDLTEELVSSDIDDEEVFEPLYRHSLAMAHRYSNPVGFDLDRGVLVNKSTGKSTDW